MFIIKTFIKNFFISIGITLSLMLIFAVLLAKTSLDEDIMPLGIIVISTISLIIGGYFIGKKVKSKGIIFGAIFRINIYVHIILNF